MTRTFALIIALGLAASALALVATAPAASAAGGGVEAITPTRVLDTRSGLGADGPVGPGETITLDLVTPGAVPADASVVVLNVTSTAATSSSFVTVWPTGQAQPTSSNLNTEPGQDTPNLVVVGVGDNGSIDLYNNSGTVHLVADVTGFAGSAGSAGGVVPVEPTRLLDTRAGDPLGPEGRRLVVAGSGPVPTDATAAILNVTSTEATEPAFVTLWPAGEARPTSSTLNTEPGQDTPNLALVKLGTDGAISLFNSAGSTHLIADIAGWVDGAPDPISTPKFQDVHLRSGYLSKSEPDDNFARQSYGDWGLSGAFSGWIESQTLVSNFGINEDFDVRSGIFATFGPSRSDADLRVDLDWVGALEGFIGIETQSHATISVRLNEQKPAPQGLEAFFPHGLEGAQLWRHEFVNTALGIGWNAGAGDQVTGGGELLFTDLPQLDTNQPYRVTVEVHCNSRVGFVAGFTTCDFRTGDRFVALNGMVLEYDIGTCAPEVIREGCIYP